MNEPKMVYVVTNGEYSDYQIEGVFSTRALAEAYESLRGPSVIEEWPIDEKVGQVKRTMFRYEMPTDRAWDIDVLDSPTKRTPDNFITTVRGEMFWADSYVSAEHARDLAVKEQQRRLREMASRFPVNPGTTSSAC